SGMINSEHVVYFGWTIKAYSDSNTQLAQCCDPIIIHESSVRLKFYAVELIAELFARETRESSESFGAHQHGFTTMKDKRHAMFRAAVTIFVNTNEQLIKHLVGHESRPAQIALVSMVIHVAIGTVEVAPLCYFYYQRKYPSFFADLRGGWCSHCHTLRSINGSTNTLPIGRIASFLRSGCSNWRSSSLRTF